jgi:hypothetical protein
MIAENSPSRLLSTTSLFRLLHNVVASHMFPTDAHVPRLLENDGLVVVEEDSVFDVPTNGARENHFFKVASFFY